MTSKKDPQKRRGPQKQIKRDGRSGKFIPVPKEGGKAPKKMSRNGGHGKKKGGGA